MQTVALIIVFLIILSIIIYAIFKLPYTSKTGVFYGEPFNDLTISMDNSEIEEIGTVNSFLHEQEVNKIIYIVKLVYFKPGDAKEEAHCDEKVFNYGSDFLRKGNEVRLNLAQKYFDITCQNMLLKKSKRETSGSEYNSFEVTLSCVQNIEGIIETTVLKSINQDNIIELGREDITGD